MDLIVNHLVPNINNKINYIRNRNLDDPFNNNVLIIIKYLCYIFSKAGHQLEPYLTQFDIEYNTDKLDELII
jgi:hypothetical protein